MFCPQAIDYGNAADWVSGIGSMLAVFVALGIATIDHLRRTQERSDERSRQATIETAYRKFTVTRFQELDDALRIAIAGGQVADLRTTNGKLIADVKRIQSMPDIDIQRFMILQDLFRFALDVDSEIATPGWSQTKAKALEAIRARCAPYLAHEN